jgi:hypothetical protein
MTAEIVSLKDYRRLRGLPPARQDARAHAWAAMKLWVERRPPPLPHVLWRPGFKGPVDLRGESATMVVINEPGYVSRQAWLDLAQEPFKEIPE